MEVRSTDGPWTSPLLFSALPSGVARIVEPAAAGAGHLVVSNASAFRDDPDVPLIIPEVNPDHLELLERQKERWPGGIVTNPNCVVTGLATALAPLHRAFGLERLVVTTFQAISGAGRPGPSALDVVDNLIPFIPGEEEKIGDEPRKILGDAEVPASFPVDATAVRVPVLHGHTVSVSASFRHTPTPEDAREALVAFGRNAVDGSLPSSPRELLVVTDDPSRPQPRLDRDAGNGLTVTVGRIRRGEAMELSFLVLAHNLVRGAAGAALLNGELCVARGLVEDARE
jgi:aspartate-semialdehyde dehydrogenase